MLLRWGYLPRVALASPAEPPCFERAAQISDVQKVVSGDTFERPIYAGNATATVRSKDSIKVFTVRTASFDAASEGSSEVSVEDGKGTAGELQSEWVSEELTVSDRPDLGSATKVVSGGRGLKNKENFDTIMEPLADALGAAIGASRAAVDSGYADNSLQVRAITRSSASWSAMAHSSLGLLCSQVGQTGKVRLYQVAVWHGYEHEKGSD